MRHLLVSVLSLGVLLGCDGDPPVDDGGARDAGDGTMDAGDGTTDAGPGNDDAGTVPDAGAPMDAGPPVDPLAGMGTVEMVQGGFMFLEGPHWREADGVLLFTDIPANRIHRLTPPSAVDTFREPSFGANGLASLPDGRLLAAEHGGRRVSVADASDNLSDFAATDAMGRTFNSPNDIAVRSDGTVYFTDPPYGLQGRMREIPFNGVFRVAPGGAVSVVWMSTMMSQRPNGVSLSPDEQTLYVADTADALVRRFDVAMDGSTSGEATFVTGTPGADGMAVDTVGNLFVTTANGVMVFSPDGTTWGTISVPQTPANCAFGDADHRTLYITARTALYRVQLTVPGRI